MTGIPPGGGDWALFVDFDGTLVELAPTPDAVAVPAELRKRLRQIGERLSGALAIVTGRDLASLDRVVDLGDLDVCALHGLEWRRGGQVTRPALPSLSAEIARLTVLFRDRPGVLVEDKGVGLAVHWRLDPGEENHARAEVMALADRLGPPYRVQDGKSVCELVPGHAGKGDGIRAMMLDPPYLGRRPCFVGDDRTDEHGFAAVNAFGGVSVKIGPGPTSATRRLPSVPAFADTLAAWAEFGVAPDALPGTEEGG